MGQLGDTLRERRTTLGITLAEAEEQTKIRGKLLAALEDGDYDRLPNPGYVRGYITSYARYLELDAPALLAMYRAETGASRYHDIAPQDTAVSPRGEQHAMPWRVGVAVVVVLAVLSIGVWAFIRLSRGPEKPPPIPTIPEASSTASPSGEETVTSPAVDPAQKPPAEYTPFTVRIVVASGQASYVEVKVDGKSAYTGSLTGGSSKKFEVTKKAVLTIGRPSAVTVYRDKKKVDVPTSAGIGKLTLTAEPAP